MTPAREPSMTDLTQEITNAVGTKYSVARLRDCVSLIEPRIVLLSDIPDGVPATLDVIVTRIEELVDGLTSYGIVSDLAEASAGSITAEYRAYVPQRFKRLAAERPGLCHFATAFYGNPLARVLAKFMIGRLGAPTTLHKSRDLALQAVRAALPPME